MTRAATATVINTELALTYRCGHTWRMTLDTDCTPRETEQLVRELSRRPCPVCRALHGPELRRFKKARRAAQ